MSGFDFDAEIEFLDARIAALNDGRTHSVRPKVLAAVSPMVEPEMRAPVITGPVTVDIGLAPAKGSCPKCGKHVGRGISLHVKRCQD